MNNPNERKPETPDYAEAREILRRLQEGDRAVFTDMAGKQTPLADMHKERKDDE